MLGSAIAFHLCCGCVAACYCFSKESFRCAPRRGEKIVSNKSNLLNVRKFQFQARDAVLRIHVSVEPLKVGWLLQ